MAHDAESPRLGVNTGFPGDFSDHPPGNELEKLVEDGIIGSGWCFFCVHTPTEWQGFKPGASPLFTQIQEFLWDACDFGYLKWPEPDCIQSEINRRQSSPAGAPQTPRDIARG
jgi:hypothetical protein